jgi:hypothetical protein
VHSLSPPGAHDRFIASSIPVQGAQFTRDIITFVT